MPPHNQAIRRARTPQRKINLARKRMAAKGSDSSVWYICKRQNSSVFFLAEYDDDNNTAMWCKRKGDALLFHTEAGIYQFVSTYLNDRKDIVLLQSPGS